jgi:hypothetical protein
VEVPADGIVTKIAPGCSRAVQSTLSRVQSENRQVRSHAENNKLVNTAIVMSTHDCCMHVCKICDIAYVRMDIDNSRDNSLLDVNVYLWMLKTRIRSAGVQTGNADVTVV